MLHQNFHSFMLMHNHITRLNRLFHKNPLISFPFEIIFYKCTLILKLDHDWGNSILSSYNYRNNDFLRSNQYFRYLESYSAYKFQNKQLVEEGPYYKYFFHPYMQATTMFFGEFLALISFIVLKYRNPEKYKMDMLEARSKGK